MDGCFFVDAFFDELLGPVVLPLTGLATLLLFGFLLLALLPGLHWTAPSELLAATVLTSYCPLVSPAPSELVQSDSSAPLEGWLLLLA